MPARRLDGNPGNVGLYDVVGLDAEAVSHFVCHAGLSREQNPAVTDTTPIGMAHMMPPLDRAGPAMAVQCVGQVPLTDDEAQRIGLFIDELELEYEASRIGPSGQYVVRPHCVHDEETDTTPTRRRFSCGGFVIEAYRFVDIDLLVTEEDALPDVTVETLRMAYPSPVQMRGLSTPDRRRPLGLIGDGPGELSYLATSSMLSLQKPYAMNLTALDSATSITPPANHNRHRCLHDAAT